MKKKLLSGIIIGILFLAGEAGATDMVVGGEFENPVIPLGSPYLINVLPMGWSGTGDIVVQGYAGAVTSGDGNQWFDLNPGYSMGTGISQNIFLTAGMIYSFSFLYNGGGGGTTTKIFYSLNSGLGSLFLGDVSTAGMNVYGGTLWNTFFTTFVPTNSGLHTLSFIPNGTYSGGFIDGIAIWKSDTQTTPGLTDVITLLRILSGISVSNPASVSDVNGDGKFGLEEVIYILQKVAGLR